MKTLFLLQHKYIHMSLFTFLIHTIALFENLMAEEREGDVVMGEKWKRRKGKEKIEEEEKYDPLAELGSDVMIKILSWLDARSVALSLLVSRSWYAVASADRLWASLCNELWLTKAHIPRVSLASGLLKLESYSLSMKDGKRTRIMKEDLWDHAWEFHYNQMAPAYFRNLDPYWKGIGRPMRRYFHPDGSQTADADDEVWGGHEACFCVVTSFKDDGNMKEHYVRINRWPRLLVTRNADWSWEMSNHLYSYTSLPDIFKIGGTGPLYPSFRLTG